MLVYLDMCCLKRPFDDQSQMRIRLETEALLGLLAMEPDTLQFVRSAALHIENSLNPVPERAARVSRWLGAYPVLPLKNAQTLDLRTHEFVTLGFKMFDA